jgi:hypothetical protein
MKWIGFWVGHFGFVLKWKNSDLISQRSESKSSLFLPHVTVAEDDPVRVDGLVGRRKEGRHDGLQVLGSTRESVIFESSEKCFRLHHYWRN